MSYTHEWIGPVDGQRHVVQWHAPQEHTHITRDGYKMSAVYDIWAPEINAGLWVVDVYAERAVGINAVTVKPWVYGQPER